jgi:hypothetical protein
LGTSLSHAAGILLFRGDGSDVTAPAGDPIGAAGHRGAFIAGIDEEARRKIAAIARKSLK